MLILPAQSLNVHCVQVPQQALEWSFRRHLLLEEILKPQADIVCLQEVNTYGTPVLKKSHSYFCFCEEGTKFCPQTTSSYLY